MNFYSCKSSVGESEATYLVKVNRIGGQKSTYENVKAECGDFVVEDYPDHTYLSTFKFVPGQVPISI